MLEDREHPDAVGSAWLTEDVLTEDVLTEDVLTEDELTELALSTRAGLPVAEDAVPLATYLGQDPGLLPGWYMPSPMTRMSPRWRLPVVVALVAAFLLIEAFGLCSTFGQVVPA